MPSVLHNADKAVRDKVAGVNTSINKQEVSSGDVQWLIWSAYHAENQQVTVPPPATNVLLPLFTESAHSGAMKRHSMDIVKSSVQHLNPSQTTVIAADQSLYAIAKTLQWTLTNGASQELSRVSTSNTGLQPYLYVGIYLIYSWRWFWTLSNLWQSSCTGCLHWTTPTMLGGCQAISETWWNYPMTIQRY